MGNTGSRHTPLELFAATGETRQIYARDLRVSEDAPLLRLEVGQAPAIRPDCRAGHLVCPIPGCARPAYSTRGGSRRDHFFHLAVAGNGHGPETWFHYVGKRVIAQWLAERYPEARVAVDSMTVESGQLPDVLSVFPDGRRFAFEIQYAQLTVEAWTERHERYRGQGISDVWLFGHRPPHLRPDRMSPEQVVLPPLQKAIEESGERVHWLNPDDGTVASLRQMTDEGWADAFMEGYEIQYRGRRIAIEPLSACFINGTAFTTALDRREGELLAAATKERTRRREREAAEEAERARKKAWREHREAEEAATYARAIRPWVLGDLAGALRVIEVRLPGDPTLRLHPFHWHALFFRDLIQGHVGQRFTYTDACRPFMDYGTKPLLYRAITGYLFHLAREGYVRFQARGYSIASEIEVRGDADHRPPPRRW